MRIDNQHFGIHGRIMQMSLLLGTWGFLKRSFGAISSEFKPSIVSFVLLDTLIPSDLPIAKISGE